MLRLFEIRWLYHLVIWVLGISFLVVLTLTDSNVPAEEIIPELIAWVLPIVPIVYLNFYIKKRYLEKRNYKVYFILFPLQVILGIALYKLSFWLIADPNQPIIRDAFNVIFILLLTTGLQYFKRGIVNQYQLQELKAKNSENELNSLKAQINPHFLFNNLNNIYSINQVDSNKGSEMIMELAEVMRYHLQFSKQKYVSISSEFQLIQSYIELEKLRLKENCSLNIQICETDEKYRIAPLLLLPFVENAFKHGTHPTQLCFVDLSIDIENGRLCFKIKNSPVRNKKIIKTHIGLENTTRRLELLYPERHRLQIKSDEKLYEVKLELDL